MSDEHKAVDEVDAALADCRQGDVFELAWTAHLGSPTRNLTGARTANTELNKDVVVSFEEAERVAVVSQTCDVAEPCATGPCIELAPIVTLEGDTARLAGKSRIPRYVAMESLGENAFVDLSRVTRVEKTVLLGVKRERGCLSDESARKFAIRVGHKLSRPAFPDDIVESMRGMVVRLKEKSGKNSDEGRRADLVEDVRLVATPSLWATADVSLFFYFVLPPSDYDVGFSGDEWDTQVDEWIGRCTTVGSVTSFDGMPVRFDEMTADVYAHSDSVLEADVLSPRVANPGTDDSSQEG